MMETRSWTYGQCDAAVHAHGVAVLPPGHGPTVHRLWELFDQGASFTQCVQLLTSDFGLNLDQVPDFVLMVVEDNGIRVAVRGSFNLHIRADQQAFTIDGDSLVTWTEHRFTSIDAWCVTLGHPVEELPEAHGVVRDAVLKVDTLWCGALHEAPADELSEDPEGDDAPESPTDPAIDPHSADDSEPGDNPEGGDNPECGDDPECGDNPERGDDDEGADPHLAGAGEDAVADVVESSESADREDQGDSDEAEDGAEQVDEAASADDDAQPNEPQEAVEHGDASDSTEATESCEADGDGTGDEDDDGTANDDADLSSAMVAELAADLSPELAAKLEAGLAAELAEKRSSGRQHNEHETATEEVATEEDSTEEIVTEEIVTAEAATAEGTTTEESSPEATTEVANEEATEEAVIAEGATTEDATTEDAEPAEDASAASSPEGMSEETLHEGMLSDHTIEYRPGAEDHHDLADSHTGGDSHDSGAGQGHHGQPMVPAPAYGTMYDQPEFHDGHTVNLAALAHTTKAKVAISTPESDEQSPEEGRKVLAVPCVADHPNPPYLQSCRVCGQEMSRTLIHVDRPSLGRLILSSGEVIELDRDIVFGRNPKDLHRAGRSNVCVVTIESEENDISRTHCEIRVDGWDARVRDLGSQNGTFITHVGQSSRRVEQSRPEILRCGDIITLAESISIRLEC